MLSIRDKYLKNIFLLLLIFLFITILFFTYIMADVLVPIFVAIFSAMFLHPFINNLHKAHIPRWLSTLIVITVFITIIAILITILTFSFTFFLDDLNKNLDELRTRLGDIVDKISKDHRIKNFFKRISRIDISEDQIKSELLNFVQDILTLENLIKFMVGNLSKTFDVLKSFFMYILALIFVIPGISRISDKITRAFPDDKGKKINDIILNIINQIQNYMFAKFIVSFLVGFCSFLICLILGVKYALLWGFTIFLLNFIPYIGSIIAVLFPIIQASTQYVLGYYPLFDIIILTILLISAQMIIAYIVEPKLMSRGVNLSPIIILIGLLVWGYIWGMVGVILSVPIMSAINLICQNIIPLQPISVFISAKPKEKEIKKNKKNHDKDNINSKK